MTHSNEELDDFDRLLDRARHGPEHGNGYRSEPARAADRLLALDARDATADPRPGFLANLAEQLGIPSPARAQSTLPASTHAPSTRPRAPRLAIPDAGPARWLVTAALMLAIVLVASFALRGGSDNPESNVTSLLPNSDAVAPLGFEPVDIAECTTPARNAGTAWNLIGQTPSQLAALPSLESITSMVATPGQAGNAVGEIGLALLTPYPAVSSDVINDLTATLRQTTACRFASIHVLDGVGLPWLDGPYYASFTDDFIRRSAFFAAVSKEEDGASTTRALIGMSFVPAGPAPWMVEAARIMPDGRVIAIVVPGQPTPAGFGAYVMVFAHIDGHWLIDELLPIALQQYFSTQSAAPLVFDIVLDDPEGSMIAPLTGSGATFYANQPVTVTIANLGPTPQEFHLDALGIILAIEAGHSISFALTAPAGAYVLDTYVRASHDEDEFSLRRFEAIIRFVGEGTPIGIG